MYIYKAFSKVQYWFYSRQKGGPAKSFLYKIDPVSYDEAAVMPRHFPTQFHCYPTWIRVVLTRIVGLPYTHSHKRTNGPRGCEKKNFAIFSLTPLVRSIEFADNTWTIIHKAKRKSTWALCLKLRRSHDTTMSLLAALMQPKSAFFF